MSTIRAMFVPSMTALAQGVDPIAWTLPVSDGIGRRERIAETLGDLIATHVGASTTCCGVVLDPQGEGDDVIEFSRDVLDDEPMGSATWTDAA
jgi:hypothetical protein